MTSIKSSKAKGRRLQNYVRDWLRKIFCDTTKVPRLKEDDIKSQTMGMTGEDIVLSPRAQEVIPYSFECKNQEKISIWKALEQSESNANGRCPVVIIKRNRSKTYAVLEFRQFAKLIGSDYE
tara:strand:+ start:320 stop:685 length:366 start_codon:yes stop_codon:yes gene_type:complete